MAVAVPGSDKLDLPLTQFRALVEIGPFTVSIQVTKIRFWDFI